MNHQIDINDLAYAEERYGKLVGWIPGAVNQQTGKVNPQVTQGVREDGSFVSVFHVKPAYYETPTGNWRPLSEVTLHHGNRTVVMNENWWQVHPRYLGWLDKRCRVLGGQLLIPSSLKSYPTPYTGVVRSIHESLVPLRVGLTTTTVYPDPDPETTSCDGEIYTGENATWATVHDIATGASVNLAGADMAPYSRHTGTVYRITRCLVLFDTSSIPDGDTISSATLSGYCTGISAGDNDAQAYLSLVSSTPSSNTNPTTADIDQIGDALANPTKGATDISISSFTTSAYNDYALNATGLTWVSKTGVSKFGFREGHDVEDSAIGGTTWNYVIFVSADAAGTTQDPKLVVVHAAASSGPANLKSYNTNLVANIKSINTNPIANVKSLNTNV